MVAPIHPTMLIMSSLFPAPVLQFPRKSFGVVCEHSLGVLPADPTDSCSKATYRLRSTHPGCVVHPLEYRLGDKAITGTGSRIRTMMEEFLHPV